MKTKKKLTFAELPEDYPSLCQIHLPRISRDQQGYQATEEICDCMAGFEEAFTNDQCDYFELLTDLMWDYEQRQIEEPPKP